MGQQKANSVEVFQVALADIMKQFDTTPFSELQRQLLDLLLMMTLAVQEKEPG